MLIGIYLISCRFIINSILQGKTIESLAGAALRNVLQQGTATAEEGTELGVQRLEEPTTTAGQELK